jgi:hypothetical protein
MMRVRMLRSGVLAAWAIAACAFPFVSCLDDRQDKHSLEGPGTETVGLQGLAVYADGSPARNAAVTARQAGYLSTAFPRGEHESRNGLAVTDSLGRYRLDSLAPGDYAIEIRDSGNQAALIRCKVARKSGPQFAPQASLAHLAAVSGQLRRPEGVKVHAVVGVYGLERRVYNDYETGKFVIPDLPEGEYALHVSSLDPLQGGSLDVPGVKAVAGSNLDLGPILLDSVREDYSTWASSRKVFIRAGQAGAKLAETLSGFPVPVRLDSTNFRFDSAMAYGADLRFADSSGAPLRYEIEAWDAVHKKATVWVRMDAIRKGDDGQFFRMYFGKPGSEDLSVGRLVFDTALGFSNVWHLNEDPRVSPRLADATANGNPLYSLVPYATDTNTAPVFQGVYFNGRQGHLATDLISRAPAAFTISLWFQSFSDGKLLGFQDTPDGETPTRFDRHLWIGKEGYIHFGVNSSDTSRTPAPNLRKVNAESGYSDDWNWHHVAVTLAPDSPMAIFFDGVLEDRDTQTTGAEDYTGYWVLGTGTLGDWGPIANHRYFYGAMDEVRIEQTARSPEWIRMSYETQRMGSKVIVVSPE